MKGKRFFMGILGKAALAAVLVSGMVLTGCDQPFNGPSADEIAEKVNHYWDGSGLEWELQNIKEAFETALYNYDYDTSSGIAKWGQEASYANWPEVNVSGTISVHLPKTISVFDWGATYEIEWDPPVDSDAIITSSSSTADKTDYTLTNATSTLKSITFNFYITSQWEPRSISGTFTVSVRTSTADEVKKYAVDYARREFRSDLAQNTDISTWRENKAISAFGQTDALYTVTTKAGTLTLPTLSGLVWTPGSNGSLSGSTLTISGSAPATVDVAFTYTHGTYGAITGILKVIRTTY
ncbi:hypothetical protein FACS189493_1950 [Spirochaetia bacterium]|nr:hypothetical protein FACS189493_1950 [Spirochaetia bacterium]